MEWHQRSDASKARLLLFIPYWGGLYRYAMRKMDAKLMQKGVRSGLHVHAFPFYTSALRGASMQGLENLFKYPWARASLGGNSERMLLLMRLKSNFGFCM